jgi:hypothetical protein
VAACAGAAMKAVAAITAAAMRPAVLRIDFSLF